MERTQLILASKSPRRQQLLRDLGFEFTIKTKDVDEDFPNDLVGPEIPLFLCKHKATSFQEELNQPETIVITADTVVWIEGKVLNKPENFEEALAMLKLLSGKMHEVFTAVCLKSSKQTFSFYVATKVYFKQLTDDVLNNYIISCKPYDKAGSYGAQETLPENFNPCSETEINFLKSIDKLELIQKSIYQPRNDNAIALIDKIEGSYFNVMGLPIVELYYQLKNFNH